MEQAGDTGVESNYIEEREKCFEFLDNFIEQAADGKREKKYIEMLRQVARRTRSSVDIEIDDLANYKGDDTFVANVERNTLRYIDMFSVASSNILKREKETMTDLDYEEDVIDILQSARAELQEDGNPGEGFPPDLARRFDVHLVPPALSKSKSLRKVGAADIGHLVKIEAMVVRISDVKPLVRVATYTCDVCGYEIFQEVKARHFMPLCECPSEQCRTNQTRGKLFMQTRGTRFCKFQSAKLQELPDQVPVGHVPRCISVQIRGSLTRTMLPGDIVTLSGIFLPARNTGFKAMVAGLTADTYLHAMSITKHKVNFKDLHLNKKLLQMVDEAVEDEDIYSKLAKSLAPEIYGHVDVKKALLLQLVGGVTRNMDDGLKIRGDINVCLMGDPGVAKSQLLKHIAGLSPRGVYTTGKGSSGVGLTASVIRDKITSETTLEGGALVLADNGICCIDEFDKMQESDRTAIHEVMEQQTVSIAKAGITTTLNARTAILAAANPVYGRYNRKKSPTANINLPAALLSRFDLMFLILDIPHPDRDRALAEHITHVHRYNTHPDLDFVPLKADFIRAYVGQARRVDPFIPKELSTYVVEEYVSMRQQESADAKAQSELSMMTARQLLSILRLSQGLARLQFSAQVTEADVDEAIRLVHASKASLRMDNETTKKQHEDPISAVYHVVIEYMKRKDVIAVNYTDIEPLVIAKGFQRHTLQRTLDEYERLQIWHINRTRTRITMIDDDDDED